jgi:hypothetical protein
MMTVSLQGQRPSLAAPFNRVLRSFGYLEGACAEHFTSSVAELWGLPIGEEFVETVAGEI